MTVLIGCFFLFFETGLFPAGTMATEQTLPAPEVLRMMADIQTLSGPEFSGRQTGTSGGLASAIYVARRFRQLGLTPAGDTRLDTNAEKWAQTKPVPVPGIHTPVHLEFTTTTSTNDIATLALNPGKDFLPVLDSPAVRILAPVVFVGYGISDPARGWDEYEGIDARNRVVLFLRGKPSHYPVHIFHDEKERIARENGAIGFITLTGPVLSRYAARRGMGHQPLAFYTNAKDDRPLPGVWVHGERGSELFAVQGLSLKGIQEALNKERRPRSRVLNTAVRMKWETFHQSGTLMNILGMIPGNHPDLKNETVILGAHRDHFGEQAGLLFPGADDNASGTALLLEIARLMKEANVQKRSVLLASFNGEEQNLLGSTYYVNHPLLPLKNIVAMINVDHVGIGSGDLTVGVSNMSKEIAAHAAEQAGLSDLVKLYGFFPGGDHVPFAKAGIPTIAVVTAGNHPHFHQASDTAETIQPDKLQTAARFVFALTEQLANSD